MRPSMGAVEGLNVQRLAAALGDELPLVLRTDASAARGVLMRQGVGKVRHLQAKQLWLQENVAAGELVIAKIPRVENYADALTHPWSAHDLPFWEAMGICFIPRGQDHPEVLCSYTNRRPHEGRDVLSWPCRGHASVLGFRQPAASEPARSYSYDRSSGRPRESEYFPLCKGEGANGRACVNAVRSVWLPYFQHRYEDLDQDWDCAIVLGLVLVLVDRLFSYC